jgi:Lipid A 3-O-deacylase (PagL)
MPPRTLAFNLLLGVLLALAGGNAARAQSGPQKGGHEIQIWTGGGHAVSGVTSDAGVWNIGVRYGWVLTDSHGPGFLRGRLEYAVDAVPAFLVFETGQTSFGAGVNPFTLKWNFDAPGRVLPYFELGGGALFTNHQVPPGTSRVNFTPTSALGVHILGDKWNWSVEIRYMHISNAGISSVNPGINTMQFRIGVGMFRGGR